MIEKILERLETEELKILDIQYYKKANTTVIERCDAQLQLLEKLKKYIIQIVQEVAKDGGWIPCMEFIKWFSFMDSDEVYTNGAELVPLFRVEQMLEHYHKPYKDEEEIAKEYDEFDTIYKKVCELEKQYAKCEEDWKNVSRCIQLENLLQFFKGELKALEKKGE